MTDVRRSSFKGLLLAATILPGSFVLLAPAPAAAQIGIVLSVQLVPPALPVYVQPPMPVIGYIWTPGYWHWDPVIGYYWVPGTWVLPPAVGVLWTPPYWGWSDGLYVFHGGYWGPHVGFYGGVNYGFGYGGSGYEGGRWDGGHFAYNQTVNNFGSVHVTNVYRQNVTVINNTNVSYNGGAGGVRAQPTPTELAAEHETHVPPTSDQSKHISLAAANPALAAKNNGGRPAIAATARPAQFEGPGVVRAQGAPAHPVAPGPHPEVARPGQAQAPHPGEAPHPAAAAVRPGEGPRPGEAARPGEAPRPGEAARPGEGPRPGEAARPGEAPRPGGAARPGEGPRPAEAARPGEGPRPAEAARPGEGPRPVEAVRPAEAPHPAVAAARPVAAPRPAPAPHPAAAPRPAPPRPAPPRPAPAREEKEHR